MKVLQIHNKYRHYGGEDAVVDNEFKLLKANNIEVYQLFFNNEELSLGALLFNRTSFLKTINEIKLHKPDVVHVHNIFYKASPSILMAAKKMNVPVVITLHNFRLLCSGALFLRNSEVCIKCKNLIYPYHGVLNKCFQNSYSKSLILSTFIGINKYFNTWDKYIDNVILLTPFIKNLIKNSSLEINVNKLLIKPNSTDDFIEDNTLEKVRDGFLFVGRLSKEKGIDTLIKIFNNLPHVKLDIIGSGELELDLKRKANSNITFHGKQERGFIKQKLLKTKALLFPSICYEGLPNTIIESFSSGTPVIANNIDNINEIIEDNFNGEILNFKIDKVTIKKIDEFDKKDLTEYQINSRNTYLSKYTHEANFKNLHQIYCNLINNEKKNNKC